MKSTSSFLDCVMSRFSVNVCVYRYDSWRPHEEVTEYEQTNSYVDNVVTYLIVVAENFDQGNTEGFR